MNFKGAACCTQIASDILKAQSYAPSPIKQTHRVHFNSRNFYTFKLSNTRTSSPLQFLDTAAMPPVRTLRATSHACNVLHHPHPHLALPIIARQTRNGVPGSFYLPESQLLPLRFIYHLRLAKPKCLLVLELPTQYLRQG
jgi:hypothetical protein